MNRIVVAGLLLALCCVMSSCIRTSTLVEVRKDGSGRIISRYYFSPEVLALIAHLESGGGAQLDRFGAPDLGALQGLVTPDRSILESDAGRYGERVTFASYEMGRDDEGWRGYTAIYDFEDIGAVQIDQHSLPKTARDYVEASGQSFDEEGGGSLTFSLTRNELTIRSSMLSAGLGDLVDREQISNAEKMGLKPSETLPVVANATRGMRIGIFVRIEDGIEETNAEFTTGNLIIMGDTEVHAVMTDPDFAAFIDQAAVDPDAITKSELKSMYRKIEGMTIELAEEVKVRIQ